MKPIFLPFMAVLTLVAIVAHAATTPALTDHDFIVDLYDAGQWKPTEAEATEAKAALLIYLASADHPTKDSMEDYSEAMRPKIEAQIDHYFLQYFGGHYAWSNGGWDLNGDKEILINALCVLLPRMDRAQLSKQLVGVQDGGNCFFQAAYSLTQRKIVHFTVNGQA